MLAKNKKTGEFFAMKRLKKADIIKLRQVDHVISENTILADIDHPFLVSVAPATDFANLGWTARLHPGLKVPLFPDAVHPRRRVVHLPEN